MLRLVRQRQYEVEAEALTSKRRGGLTGSAEINTWLATVRVSETSKEIKTHSVERGMRSSGRLSCLPERPSRRPGVTWHVVSYCDALRPRDGKKNVWGILLSRNRFFVD